MPFAAEAITLTTEERVELEQMTQSRTLPQATFPCSPNSYVAEGLPYRTYRSGSILRPRPSRAGKIDS